MSPDNNLLPRHRRPEPEEWAGLHAQAERVFDTAGNFDVEEGMELIQEANCLENDRLEVNRYYALGLVTCRFAQVLAREDVRNYAVEMAAKNIESAYRASRFGINPKATYLNPVNAMCTIIEEANAKLPQPTKFVANTLAYIAAGRNYDGGKRQPIHSKIIAHAINKGTEAYDVVGADAMSGALSMYSVAMQLENSALEDILSPDTRVREQAGAALDAVKQQDLKKVATGAATLRIDEFLEGWEDSVEKAPDGKYIMHRDRLPRTPGPLPPVSSKGRKILHQDRLVCPAVQVEGMMDAAIGLVPDILTTARDRIFTPGAQ